MAVINSKDFNTPLYLWFNQLCIYKTDTLDRFWQKINYDGVVKELNYLTFDYYIYMYYLILFEGFVVHDMKIKAEFGVYESRYFIENLDQKYKEFPVYLTTMANLSNFDNENLFLLIHLDR